MESITFAAFSPRSFVTILTLESLPSVIFHTYVPVSRQLHPARLRGKFDSLKLLIAITGKLYAYTTPTCLSQLMYKKVYLYYQYKNWGFYKHYLLTIFLSHARS